MFTLAWHGLMTGSYTEEKLKGHTPYTYLLREGEYPFHYYVSFVFRDHTIKHQPFLIRLTPHGWYCKNGSGSGPFIHQTIQEIIHLIMHCSPEECIPLH